MLSNTKARTPKKKRLIKSYKKDKNNFKSLKKYIAKAIR